MDVRMTSPGRAGCVTCRAVKNENAGSLFKEEEKSVTKNIKLFLLIHGLFLHLS